MDVAAQIVIDRVSHTYRPPRGRPVLALDNISPEVRDREFVALLGPSGCGKSTLLYLLGGFQPVEQGVIRVEDKPVAGPGPDRGVVFQHFALFPWKTVRQNVLYRLEKQRDVQEAVLLAERIAVMSARPGRIKEIVEARFDKEDPGISRSPPFVEMVEHVWNLVRAEAILAQRGAQA